jgi:hypothetical protein
MLISDIHHEIIYDSQRSVKVVFFVSSAVAKGRYTLSATFSIESGFPNWRNLFREWRISDQMWSIEELVKLSS